MTMRHKGCIMPEVETVTGRPVQVDGLEVKLTQQSPLKVLFTARWQPSRVDAVGIRGPVRLAPDRRRPRRWSVDISSHPTVVLEMLSKLLWTPTGSARAGRAPGFICIDTA